MSKREVPRLLLVLGLVGFGCVGNADSGMPPGAISAAGLRDCSDPGALRAATIPEFVAGLKHSWSYTPLSIDAMNAITAATRALDAGDVALAADNAKRAGYRVAPLLVDTGCHWLLEPTESAAAGQALLIYAASWSRDLVIEAPHVPEDNGTGDEAAVLFARLHAKAVMVAGAHRCAVTDPSGCRVSTQCNRNGVSVESDLAHSVHNALNAMHLAFRTTDALVLQLHSNFKPDLNGDATVSNGTRYPIAGTVSDAFYDALRAPDIDARSCNDPALPPASGTFCGETSTQSLSSNGAADPCLGRPSSGGGPGFHQFIHLEQANTRMDAIDTWADRIGGALEVAIPLRR